MNIGLANHKIHINRNLKVKRFVSKPKKKLKAGQKQPPKRSGTVKKLVTKAISGKLRNFCPEIVLQKLIAHLVVGTSSAMGILGDVNALSVAFDGLTFYLGASRHDSITTIFALEDIHKLYPDLDFKSFLADGAMDNYPIRRKGQ